MSNRRMEQSKNSWKQKAKSKGKEVRELKKQMKKLFEQLHQAKKELQKHKIPTSGAQAAPRKPAKEEKKSLKDTGSS
ncbi:hypothetical protein ES705_34933 [subsurface metagenome]